MKLHDTAKYLELALSALDEGVLPDVTSETGKENFGLVRAILLELYKREGSGIDLLLTSLCDGETLCLEIERVLDHANHFNAVSENKVPRQRNFDILANEYENLTRRLNDLCIKLSTCQNKTTKSASLLRRAAEWEHSYFHGLQQLDGTPSRVSERDGNRSDDCTAPAEIVTKEFLQGFLAKRRGPVQVENFTAVPGGYSNLTYFAGIKQCSGDTEEIVVRKSVPAVQAPFLNLEQEFSLLAALQKTGFLCPRPLDLGVHVEGIDDTFYTMERLPGSPPGTYFHAEKPPSEGLLLELAQVLAQLHSVPRDVLTEFTCRHMDETLQSETIQDCYIRNLRSLRQHVQRVDHLPSPYITWLFDWLESNIPNDTRPAVLTHGDFNIHNVLADDNDHITGVIDWETADFGAPELDLSSVESQVSKHMDWQRFLDHYHASGPTRVNPEIMSFCLAYSMLRLTLTVSRKVLDVQLGLLNDPRYVMIQFVHTPGLMQLGLTCTKPS